MFMERGKDIVKETRFCNYTEGYVYILDGDDLTPYGKFRKFPRIIKSDKYWTYEVDLNDTIHILSKKEYDRAVLLEII